MDTTTTNPVVYDAIVIGGGPVGLATAIALAQADIKVALVAARKPYPDNRTTALLGGTIDVGCPVRILQGAQDPDVPWQHAFALTHCLPSDDVVLTLVQDGDHRLSRPQDIARILAAVTELAEG